MAAAFGSPGPAAAGVESFPVMAVNLKYLSDESLLAYYESIRRQAAADANLGGRHRLVGDSVKNYAEELQREMEQRQLRFTPIAW